MIVKICDIMNIGSKNGVNNATSFVFEDWGILRRVGLLYAFAPVMYVGMVYLCLFTRRAFGSATESVNVVCACMTAQTSVSCKPYV